MTNIPITYTKNSKGKFDFVAEQNGVKIYTKTYSPRVSEMQHFMGYALSETANREAQLELEHNPDFKWANFEEFKSWIGNPELRNKAVAFYHENEEEWTANPTKGW